MELSSSRCLVSSNLACNLAAAVSRAGCTLDTGLACGDGALAARGGDGALAARGGDALAARDDLLPESRRLLCVC